MNEYSTKEQLEKIKKWEINNIYEDLIALAEYVCSLWTYPNYATLEGKKVKILELHTGGWSGNEDILNALSNNQIFWSFCWIESRRGGHHKFKIKPIKIK